MSMIARLDACPACAPGDAPVALPQPADDPAISTYRCPLCGAAWRTRWAFDGWPIDRQAA